MISLALAIVAALCFTTGGVFMKLSDGLTRPAPTLTLMALFAIGAGLNAILVKRAGEMGSAYLLVLALEGVLAFALGAVLFGEPLTKEKVGAVLLLLIGIIALEGAGGDEPAKAAESPPAAVRSAGPG